MALQRHHLAVGGTCVALGGLGAFALSAGGSDAQKASATAAAAPVEVRTVTVTRRIHRVKVEHVRR
ncbi:MAG TPA: hypothetical protein VLB47_09505, partial [Solirubrobacteraceae bacterium]|nr:hypothetical protein [Solirubrobacteraceae bacterium]